MVTGIAVAIFFGLFGAWQGKSAKRQADAAEAALQVQQGEIDRVIAQEADRDAPRFRAVSATWRGAHEFFGTIVLEQESGPAVARVLVRAEGPCMRHLITERDNSNPDSSVEFVEFDSVGQGVCVPIELWLHWDLPGHHRVTLTVEPFAADDTAFPVRHVIASLTKEEPEPPRTGPGRRSRIA